uniref:Helitron helicase-like domain-containing protein n=1 Tax=Aegilops tauschii subsp. strangulata TaxID=200361 RepID=A0A453BY95_AEGTS
MTVQHTSAPAAHHTKRKEEQPLNSKSTKRTRTGEGRRNTNTEAPKRLRKDSAEEDKELKCARSGSNKNNIRINVGDNNRTNSNKGMELRKAWNFGRPTYKCQYCKALLWCEERLNSNKGTKTPSFGICCKQGKIDLPPLREPPPYLRNLLRSEGQDSVNFKENIRSYNSMFSFTSMGGVVDKEINTRKGPYVFRLHGQNYHHIGTLLPEGTNKPRFAQLYIYNTENEVANRISASRCNDNKSTVDPNIVKELQIMLDDNNILAKTFRMARDRFQEGDYHDYTLRILGKRNGTHNLPSASEVAALVVRDPTGESEGRDIVVEYKNMVPQRISEIHPKFMSMQYPLLFPYGEDGFKLEIPYKKTKGAKNSRKYVTLLDYYAFYLQQRPDQGMLLLKSGHLSLQFWVDVYTCIEQNRLNWIRHNQGKLRTELYSGLQHAIKRRDTRTEQVGKRIIVPSSFTGGRRNKAQYLQDAFAICSWAGYPDLFITFTCNAKWPEIQYMLDEAGGDQKPADRPDILDRVFMIKLKELTRDIKEKKYFGETLAIIYTIEFQRRGLPHAHILIFLKDKDKYPEPSQIDKIISAEIPNKDEDPEAFGAVENFMMHRPCGEAKQNSPCMVGHRCSKHFPKRYNVSTTIDEDGFPVYKRKDDGRQIKKGVVMLDNRFVVPYN